MNKCKTWWRVEPSQQKLVGSDSYEWFLFFEGFWDIDGECIGTVVVWDKEEAETFLSHVKIGCFNPDVEYRCKLWDGAIRLHGCQQRAHICVEIDGGGGWRAQKSFHMCSVKRLVESLEQAIAKMGVVEAI